MIRPNARDEYGPDDFEAMCAEIEALRRANDTLADDVAELVDEARSRSQRRHPSGCSPRTSSPLDDVPDASRSNVVSIHRGGL